MHFTGRFAFKLRHSIAEVNEMLNVSRHDCSTNEHNERNLNEVPKAQIFHDESGLIVHVRHTSFPLKSVERGKPLVEEQPCSQILIEVPPSAPLSIEEVYESLTGNKPGAEFSPIAGNILLIGRVHGTWDQQTIMAFIRKGQLISEKTLRAVNDYCNAVDGLVPTGTPHLR